MDDSAKARNRSSPRSASRAVTSLTKPQKDATALSKRTRAASTCEASTCLVRSGDSHSAARESSVAAEAVPAPAAGAGVSLGSHVQNT